MGAENISINYAKVKKETSAIKKDAENKLAESAEEKYSKLISSMENCKGDFKNAIVEELKSEKKAVLETAKFIKRLQNMIQKTSEDFKKVDKSYKKGARM